MNQAFGFLPSAVPRSRGGGGGADMVESDLLPGDLQQQEVGELAQFVHEQIVDLRAQIERSFMVLARYLWLVREQRLWRPLGYQSFDAYLASPDVALSRATVYRYLQVADGVMRLQERGFVLPDTDVEAMGMERARAVLPSLEEAMQQGDVDAWVANAKALSAADLRRLTRSSGEWDDEEEWRDGLRRRLIVAVNQLESVRDLAGVLAVLDGVCARCMGAREEALERQGARERRDAAGA